MNNHTEANHAGDPLYARIREEIIRLGLESHIQSLDDRGYTVIEPELACPNGLADRLLDACLDLAERRRGVRPDLGSGATHANHKGQFQKLAVGDGQDSPIGDQLASLIFEGQVFEEALMNPILLAVATYLCGYSVVLASMGCLLKGPNKSPLEIHCDTQLPPPFPAHALVCNITYALTPFDLENGATAFVPGSHKLGRAPVGDERKIIGNPDVEAVQCRAGSLVCWHGWAWHGGFNRTAPGLRVSIPVLMARPNMRTPENLIDRIPQATLDRNPARFAILTQQGIRQGWHSEDHSKTTGARAASAQAAYVAELGFNPGPSAGSLFA